MEPSRKPEIHNLSYLELEDYLDHIGEKRFRARQVFAWIYQKDVADFIGMTDLSHSLRNNLQEDFLFRSPLLLRKEVSADYTTKFLFDEEDHEKVETVLIPASHRNTVCVSTQAGCKFGCRFCASGVDGWTRNLSCAEIVTQILYVRKESRTGPLTHIVFMGTGEPLATVSLRC